MTQNLSTAAVVIRALRVNFAAYSFGESMFYLCDFNNRNKCFTTRLLNKDIAVINFVKHFQNYFTDTHLMDFRILYHMFYSISDKYL